MQELYLSAPGDSLELLLRKSIAQANQKKNGKNVISVVPNDGEDKTVRTVPATSEEQVAVVQEFWDILAAENPSEAIRLYEFFTGKHMIQYLAPMEEAKKLPPTRERRKK